MEHIVWGKKDIPSLVLPHLYHKLPLKSSVQIPDRKMTQTDAGLLETMVEQDVKSFHQKSKNAVVIIYDLSQDVYYRHNNNNPELAKLAASLFLLFSDFGYYLNLEKQRLIPDVQNLIEKAKYSKTDNHPAGRLIQELKQKIQREHYSMLDKLKYFRTLTEDYRLPAGADKSYKLLFDKLRIFENDLVMYIHFEYKTFFPLAIKMENYLNEIN